MWERRPLAVMEVLGVVVVLLLPHPLDEKLAKGEEVKDTTAVADVVSDTLLVMEVLGVEVVLLLTQALGVKVASGEEVPLRLTDRVAVTDWEAEGEGELLTLKVGRRERDIDTEGVEV